MERKEHFIVKEMGHEMSIVEVNDNHTEINVYPFTSDGASMEITNEQALLVVKALLPKILERGDLDALIKTWIEQNMLDGDPMDDCGECIAHMKPNDMYELVYDCVDGIMEN